MPSVVQFTRSLQRPRIVASARARLVQRADLHASAVVAVNKFPAFKPGFGSRDSSDKGGRGKLSEYISSFGKDAANKDGRSKLPEFMSEFGDKKGGWDHGKTDRSPFGASPDTKNGPAFGGGRFTGKSRDSGGGWATDRSRSSSSGWFNDKPRDPGSGWFSGKSRDSSGGQFGDKPRETGGGRFADRSRDSGTAKAPGAMFNKTSRLPAAGARPGKMQVQDAIQKQIEARVARSRKETPGKAQRAPRDEEIDSPMITLVSEEGVVQGVHPLTTVLRGMDRDQFTLVMVDPNEKPPTCRLFLRKVLYDREKQAKKQNSESKRKTKVQMLQVRSSIGEHDIEIKSKKLIGMLEKGRRVTVVVEKAQNDKGSGKCKVIGETLMKSAAKYSSVSVPPNQEKTMWSVTLQSKGSE